MTTIRVELPSSLCALAGVGRDVLVQVPEAATQRTVLDALEAALPMLRGVIRDQVTKQRRPFIRFFGCEQDLSFCSPDAPLPGAIVAGRDAFMVVGAIAGG